MWALLNPKPTPLGGMMPKHRSTRKAAKQRREKEEI